jgi:hypothetical protein
VTSDRQRGPTQVERVLSLLRERAAGGHPLNTVDLLAPTTDGGKPILRLPARINELRGAGFAIATSRAPNGTANYFLRAQPPPALPTPVASIKLEEQPGKPDEQPRLFPTTGLQPRDREAA